MKAASLTFTIALALTAGAARAATTFDYNLFVLGDMTASGSDVEGRVAVRGNANLGGYSVGLKAPAGDNLVVGRNFTAIGGSTSGNVVAGGSINTWSYGFGGSKTANATTLPVDFAAESTRLSNLSTTLKGYSANGSTEYKWGQLFFTGTSDTLNVFTVTADQMRNSNTFHVNVKNGSQVLFNISGANAAMQYAGFDLVGVDASKILYNFHDATSLSFSGIGVQGSVLATKAAYNGGYGNVDGQMIVGSFNGPTQINYKLYSGTLLNYAPATPTPPGAGAIPEASTWAQMIAGFGLLGGALRRRRSALRTA
ncbi:choice-of-anchor A family protein [Sphingomonas sp. ID0503]|uniref:choice-of-anchor A family protein n=1 Tax=Sphingomonas sp. ID0503 TaxID=3399691 RepID=UPI003AFAFB3E